MSSMKKSKAAHKKFKAKIEHPHGSQGKGKFEQNPENAGLLVTAELSNALEDCKAKVARIAKECRAKNRKFR